MLLVLTENVGKRDRPTIELHRARQKYNKFKSDVNREVMICKSKEYKKEVLKAKRKSSKKFVNRLRNVRSKCPKDYWNLLIGKFRTKCTIILKECVKHFKELGEDITENQTNILDNDADIPELDTKVLNGYITEEEILKCIHNLKNSKASGIDYIINEYIKKYVNKLLPFYVKLFNIIITNSHFPEEWLIGMLVPIYNKGDINDVNNYRGIILLSCLGKLFTSEINIKLYNFCEINIIF